MSSFKSFDDPHEIKRRMNELGIDDFVPNSFPRVEAAFTIHELTEYSIFAKQQAKIADLLTEKDTLAHLFQGVKTLEQVRKMRTRPNIWAVPKLIDENGQLYFTSVAKAKKADE